MQHTKNQTNERHDAQKIVNEILSFDKPSNIINTLRMMQDSFFTTPDYPTQQVRVNVIETTQVLTEALQRMETLEMEVVNE